MPFPTTPCAAMILIGETPLTSAARATAYTLKHPLQISLDQVPSSVLIAQITTNTLTLCLRDAAGNEVTFIGCKLNHMTNGAYAFVALDALDANANPVSIP
jgi:hypothetical protein